MFNTFIFDMDGVIIDSEPLHFEVDQYVMNKLGVRISKQELEEYVGMTNPEMWADLVQKYNLIESIEDIISLQLQTKMAMLDKSQEKPIEGVIELITLLNQSNISIGLASSSPRVFIEAVLNKFGIQEFFQSIISGEEVAKGKPAPDIYLKTAEILQAKVEDCIVLEDSRNGVLAAKAAGMKVIGFVNMNSGIQDLSKADLVVSTITNINMEILVQNVMG